MTDSIVEVRGIAKSFGKQKVLDGLDWQIGRGRVIGLLGRNGVGKSTLIECMLGLRETDTGGVRLFGEAVEQGLSDLARARIGYVPQKAELFEWLTPGQMLAWFRAQYPRWNAAKVDGLMQRWGLDRSRYKPIAQLSVGEKQRLSIIRALAHDPALLVLDEPVASLDPAGRRDFLRELVEGVIERETTVVFSTHILSDLERVAVDVAFLREGRIALESPLDELLGSARRIVGSATQLAEIKLAGEIRREQDPSGITRILACMSDAEAEALGAQRALRVESLGLEDLFVEVTK
ncbi:ABC transporter ATP-binding protein [Massilia endophytica]|uniref:ABC transporter ATP-binding protein n=1 Tax=Massilia endophytica TaxID=2899220 RepID=UPI001E41B5C2|nr:ABC transporter ATP-binding protein [Massilia endophytica]UGQ48906.1 ABC transporter ATP-binding protein [Massilia endophytica]